MRSPGSRICHPQTCHSGAWNSLGCSRCRERLFLKFLICLKAGPPEGMVVTDPLQGRHPRRIDSCPRRGGSTPHTNELLCKLIHLSLPSLEVMSPPLRGPYAPSPIVNVSKPEVQTPLGTSSFFPGSLPCAHEAYMLTNFCLFFSC